MSRGTIKRGSGPARTGVLRGGIWGEVEAGVSAVNPHSGADVHGESLDVGARETAPTFALDGGDRGGIIGLELAGTDLVAPPLGTTSIAERFRGPMDVFRSRQR